ncbi:cytidylate kinase [Entomoplasma freundtii]|uniref:Cytidylate kinase n=1 Tax=Entomoplasma freundtii TaxID=74700 RepID=A0A2K8NVB2_9MOLU|nr:(d)CMP kinase [Entomoplasma freundtii]ATZ16573.1 cytidylate kinase [Entomoplasma freundtii]TDY58261.1 cytidylate kinase [Entomoplasma freundtii]
MSKKIVVAVDGTAGSGKSATLKKVATQIGYTFIDTGLMYRAFTLLGLNKKVDFKNSQELINLIPDFDYVVKKDKVFLNGQDVSNKLASPEILANINDITPIPEIRELMVQKQRALAQTNQNEGIIMIGRDITSVVLPTADLKIYLDASLDARAQRRYEETRNEKTNNTDLAFIKKALAERDASDKNRLVGPLVLTNNTWYLDNSTMSLDQTVDTIIAKIKQME